MRGARTLGPGNGALQLRRCGSLDVGFDWTADFRAHHRVHASSEGVPDQADVFRYDILHLLSSLPEAGQSTSRPAGLSGSRAPRSPSPALTSSSWDSVPSDAEDTFFLSGSEDLEEYERGKKRRWMEALREERLREREREDQVERKGMRGETSSSWGGAGEAVSRVGTVGTGPRDEDPYLYDRSHS
jgi:hypothetical protein